MGFFDTLFAPFSQSDEFDAYQSQQQGYRKGAEKYNKFAERGVGKMENYLQQALKQYQGVDAYKPDNRYIKDMAGRGGNYLDAYESALGMNGQKAGDRAFNNYEQSAGFQYALDQANQGLERSAAANGILSSGNTLAAVSNNTQQMASRDYGSYLDRLQGMASMGGQFLGKSADLTQQQGQFGAQYQAGLAGQQANLLAGAGSNILNAYTGMGQAQNQAQTGIGQAQAGYYGGMNTTGTNIIGTGLGIAGGIAGMPYMSGGTKTTLGGQGLSYLFG